MSHDGRRQLVGVPLADVTGHVNGVFAWVGEIGEPVPDRDQAGAFHFNLTTRQLQASDDLLDLYGVAPENRRSGRLTAEAFHRLLPNPRDADALAIIARSQPGEEYQAVWCIRRDDKKIRAVDIACRTVAQPDGKGGTEVILRGVVHDMGAARQADEGHMLLERLVISAEEEPDEARAIVNPVTMEILRWIDSALPGLAWRGEGPYPPAVHPGDQEEVRRMASEISRTGRAKAILRMRSEAGGWLDVSLSARRMPLDDRTSVALITFSAAGRL
jgi:hypothetical protein